jgi:23S rRNA pseudouridine2605 synthase
METGLVRLQKVLADAGVASRRRCEELIVAGLVTVNGKEVTVLGTQVDPKTAKILVHGRPIAAADAPRTYIALNKPVGVVSTTSDRHAKHKVTDLVQIPGTVLKPAGRLDADSEGLLLLSDDGAFIFRVTHPSQSLGKTYRVTVEGKPDDDAIDRLRRGLMLPGESKKTAEALVTRLKIKVQPGHTLLEVTLHEGRNRQIRRMLETVGHPVVGLLRMRIGPVHLGLLGVGKWRHLTKDEVATILATQETPIVSSNSQNSSATQQPARENKPNSETNHRGSARPRPGQDHRKSPEKRVPVHEDRIDRGVPQRRKYHPPDGSSGQGRRPGFRDPKRPE